MKTVDIKSNLNRETLVDRIVDILEDRILKGDLPPGTKLSEAAIAKEFEVSRVPAREALQRLQEMNLVRKDHLSRKVAKFNRDEFFQIYELKNIVEAFGAMKGALKASEQELGRIQSVVNRMESCLLNGKVKQLRYLNYDFHDLLVSCCKNEKLLETYQSLVKQIRWATSLSFDLPNRPKESFQEHKIIFETFKKREGERVRMLLETHSIGNMNRILSQMESEEERDAVSSS